MSLTIDDSRRTRRRAPLRPVDPGVQPRCLDQVMLACRPIAVQAAATSRRTQPSTFEAIDAARAVLGVDADVDQALTVHLGRCADAVGAASEGFMALGPAERHLLVTTSRALHRDPTLSGQRSVLSAIEARQTWVTHPVEGLDAERLGVGLALARAAVGAAWADCRDEVMVFRKVVSGGRPTGADPYLHVVAATVAGSLSGALSCQSGGDPRDAGLALGLAAAVRQVVSAALSTGRSRPGAA